MKEPDTRLRFGLSVWIWCSEDGETLPCDSPLERPWEMRLEANGRHYEAYQYCVRLDDLPPEASDTLATKVAQERAQAAWVRRCRRRAAR